MATPPASRWPARAASQPPATPTPPQSSLVNRPAASVEPKNEYLRTALEARRAKQGTPTPSPAERPTLQRRVSSTTPADPWLDQAQNEEDSAQVPSYRRTRRPSESGLPRMRTQRELQTETETLKDALFNLNLKLELLKKQNNELKDQVDAANKRIEELEPMEDEVIELRQENDALTLKVQDMEEEIIQLRDDNAEVFQMQDEIVANMEKQDAALDEAAEIIFQLENDKVALKEENLGLKEQVAALQTTPTAEHYNGVDGSGKDRFPSRVYSIDESRPSTSHFDSDYYSQPASPQVKASKESLPSIGYSERTRNFLETNKEGKLAVQDLKNRVSNASIRHTATRSKASPPQVPQIPEIEPEPLPLKSIKRTPKKYRPIQALPLYTARDSPIQTRSMPQTPTSHIEGLRGLFRDNPTMDNSPRDSRPSSSYAKSSLSTKRSKSSHLSDSESIHHPQPPARCSSRKTPTSGSSEHLRADKPQPSPQTETQASEWASMAPPSIISDDLTIDVEHRDRWWKNYDRLHRGKTDALLAFSKPSPARRVPHGAAALASPYQEKDLFFNSAEDEDQFIERMKGYAPRSGRER